MKARMMISPMSGSASISRGKLDARHADDAAVLAGDAADQDLAIVEQVELAGELARRDGRG
jgi:hypothetical protein